MPIAAKVKTPADSWACHVSRRAAEVPFSDGDESSSGFICKASVVVVDPHIGSNPSRR